MRVTIFPRRQDRLALRRNGAYSWDVTRRQTSTARAVPAADLDGRRRRGQDNRERIVAAMLEIICEGDASPGAEQVAARAGVGLRTVFRHFNDMESLYRQMAAAIEAELRWVLEEPLKAADWQGRVLELLGRRVLAYERMTPFKHAAEAHRHRSPFLRANSARVAAQLREVLRRELPADVAADPGRLEALDLLLSFESWSRLRREQGLSADAARQVLTAAVRRFLA